MKLLKHQHTVKELKEYPITDILKGWFFKVQEISPGIYRVEGVDNRGRLISRVGTDPDELLQACRNDALEILSNV